MTSDDLTLDTTQSIDIKADIGDVFRCVLHRLGEGSTSRQGESMQMNLEQWPGGRWFRDRGNGIGHLWGHVQVIKPPVLLELSGPMFMSYPALNHLEVKLEQRTGGTHVDLRHRAIGLIDPAHRQSVTGGWKQSWTASSRTLPRAPAAQKHLNARRRSRRRVEGLVRPHAPRHSRPLAPRALAPPPRSSRPFRT